MSPQSKPSIVFAHGLWADGSCYSKVIPTLQAEGHEVLSAQNSLDSLAGDVAAVKRALARVSSPAVLVGHSQGGTIITHAGTDDRVGALVYICALAPDEDETAASQQAKIRARTSSNTSRSPRERSGCSGTASAALPATCQSRSSSSSGRRRACRRRTCSNRRFQAPPGSRSRVGTSSATTTERSIPTWSASSPIEWERPREKSTAATSRCSRSPTS